MNGKIIDSEQLIWGYCGGEPGYYHTEHVLIKSDKLISHIDTIWTAKVDSAYNEIEGTTKLEVKVVDYVINRDGAIDRRE